MIFLFTEIDHPALFKQKGKPEADHIISCQFFLIEEMLFKHGVLWMKRTDLGVLSAFDSGEAAKAAMALQKDFQDHVWDGFGKAKIRVVLHSGQAEPLGQDYVGPEVNHALKLLDAAWGGQILLTLPAVHFIPLPPGGRILDLGVHFLKDLSEPQNVYLLQHPDLTSEQTSPPRSLQTFPQNLTPQSSPFFGREEEIRELVELLTRSATPLVSLVGPGGFGKTRLAFQTAAEVIEHFKDGVYFVPLAPLLLDQLMVGAIANVIKFFFFGSDDPKNQLLNHLREKQMLLVMDNFEHIIGGAQLVGEMLQAAPGLKILVTSREGLRIPGEKIFEIRGLRYPENGTAENMEASSAVQLFIKSAARIRPDFSLKPGEREAMVEICRLLEGMPLGLELSATWVGTLSLPEIVDKIKTSRDFLATSMPHLPPRHRSLRAVFEYSWILLSEPQKQFLKTVSVFRNGFDEEAALFVTGKKENALGYLENKSLVRKKSNGRFEIHELLKYYAKEKLFDDALEKERAMDAHCFYFSQWLKKREKLVRGAHQREVLDEMIVELDNLRESWKRAVEKVMEKELGDSLACFFIVFELKGFFSEGMETYQRAVEALREKYRGGVKVPPGSMILSAKLTARWAFFENFLGQSKTAKKLFEESLNLFRGASALKQAGIAYDGLGVVAEFQGHYEEARGYLEKSFKIYKQAKKRFETALSLNLLGRLETLMGNHKKAKTLIRQSLAFSEGSGDERAKAFSYNLLGDSLHELGHFEEAKIYFQKGLGSYLESGDQRGVAWSYSNLGREAEVMGDFPSARQMYRESMAIWRSLGDLRSLAWSTILQGIVDWATGNYASASNFYDEGLFLYREVGDLRGEAWSLDLMGNLKLAQREDQEAEKLYLKAYSLVLKEGVKLQNNAWNDYHLGAVSLYRERFEEAQKRFTSALGCFDRLEDNLGQAASLIHLGELACVKKSFGRAENLFQGAVRLALQAKAKPMLVDALVGVARMLKDQGEEQKAISYLLVAMNHPTCRQQTKDRVVSLSMELKSRFSPQEMEGAVLWAKASSIEEVAASWLASGRSEPKPGKKPKPAAGKKKKPVKKVRKKKRK